MWDKHGHNYIRGEFTFEAGQYDVIFSDDEMLKSDVRLSEVREGEPLPWARLEEEYTGEGRPRVRANYALQEAVKECNALATRLESAAAQANHFRDLYIRSQDTGWGAHVAGAIFGAGLIALAVWLFAPV